MDLCNKKEIKALLDRHGFRFSKSKGQNFLIAPWVPRQTAEASGAGPGMGVLEIGPGIGPLTERLAALADKVVSVELDRTLLPVLEETLAHCPNAEIVEGDILKTDIPALCREKLAGLRTVACANLPYNITTPAITALLRARCFEAVTVMIQREVALRICARPGPPEYGAVTLLCRYYADSELLCDVPPACFYPAPKVTSSVIRMTCRPSPPVPVADEALFFRVVRAAFNQRRKTLTNALSALGDKAAVREAVLACSLPETVRGEALGFAEFAALTGELARRQKGSGDCQYEPCVSGNK